jgi:drug/metabolite transporter (DMT)-like permease
MNVPNESSETAKNAPCALLMLILCYLTLNLSLNLYNKIVFSSYHFNFPCVIMFFHQGLLYFTLRLLTLLGILPKPTNATKIELIGPVMIVGFFFALNIICNNASLIYISLSLNQCLKAASPMIMIAVAYIVERKATPLRQIGAASVVVFGSFLVVLKNPGFNIVGVSLCMISAVTGSFQFSVAAIVMKGKTNLVFHVTMYTALAVTFLCLPAVIVLELDDFHDYAKKHSMMKCMSLLMLGGSMAIMYLLVTNALIVNGGSVYLTVLGNLKLALIVLVSCWLFSDQLEPINMIGIGVTILGFALYSFIKKLSNSSKKSGQLKYDGMEDSITEDDLDIEEERQSLLVQSDKKMTKNDAGASGRFGIFIEIGAAIFIFFMAVSLILNPHHKIILESTNMTVADKMNTAT